MTSPNVTTTIVQQPLDPRAAVLDHFIKSLSAPASPPRKLPLSFHIQQPYVNPQEFMLPNPPSPFDIYFDCILLQ